MYAYLVMTNDSVPLCTFTSSHAAENSWRLSYHKVGKCRFDTDEVTGLVTVTLQRSEGPEEIIGYIHKLESYTEAIHL